MTRDYPTHPQVGIGIIVLKGEEVLLVKRAHPPAQNQWSLPGGGQELGETAEQAARRELLEETGLEVGDLTLIAHVDSIHHDEHGRIQYQYTILDFCAVYQSGTPVPASDVLAVAWVHPKNFGTYHLWPEARRVIALAFSRLSTLSPASPRNLDNTP